MMKIHIDFQHFTKEKSPTIASIDIGKFEGIFFQFLKRFSTKILLKFFKIFRQISASI